MFKHTQTIRRLLQTNCLNVFDHFVGLTLKRVKAERRFSPLKADAPNIQKPKYDLPENQWTIVFIQRMLRMNQNKCLTNFWSMFLTTPSFFMLSFRKGQSIAYLLKNKTNLLDFHKILLPYF